MIQSPRRKRVWSFLRCSWRWWRSPRGGSDAVPSPGPSSPKSTLMLWGLQGLVMGQYRPWGQGTRVVLCPRAPGQPQTDGLGHGRTNLSSLLPSSSLCFSLLSWLVSACGWLFSPPRPLLLGDGGRVGRGMDQPCSWPSRPRAAPKPPPPRLLPLRSHSPRVGFPCDTSLPSGDSQVPKQLPPISGPLPAHTGAVRAPLMGRSVGPPSLWRAAPRPRLHPFLVSCSCEVMWEAAPL